MDSVILDSPQPVTNGTFEYEDESYFLLTYAPLSKFLTPPIFSSPSSPSSHGGTQPLSTGCEGFLSDEESPLLGPSICLSSFIPTAVSYLVPSPSLVLCILQRAKLPLEILALSVCILETLSHGFANVWRQTISLTHASPPPPNQPPHIDSVRPEIVIVSALILAQKFLDDEQISTVFWAECIGQGRWSAAQINATQLAIMKNLQWRLLPLWNEVRLAEALEDMEMAGRQAQTLQLQQSRRNRKRRVLDEMPAAGNRGSPVSNTPRVAVNAGHAVLCEQTHLWTPADTPSAVDENGPDYLSAEPRKTFGATAQEAAARLSPRSSAKEVFPA